MPTHVKKPPRKKKPKGKKREPTIHHLGGWRMDLAGVDAWKVKMVDPLPLRQRPK